MCCVQVCSILYRELIVYMGIQFLSDEWGSQESNSPARWAKTRPSDPGKQSPSGEKIKTMNHRKSDPLTDTYCMERQGLCQRQKYCLGVSLCNFGRVGSSFWSRTISGAWYAL